MTYAKHYAPRAKQDTTYHPPTSYIRANLNNAAVCRTRGSLDVTPDKEKVTCRACTSYIGKM